MSIELLTKVKEYAAAAERTVAEVVAFIEGEVAALAGDVAAAAQNVEAAASTLAAEEAPAAPAADVAPLMKCW